MRSDRTRPFYAIARLTSEQSHKAGLSCQRSVKVSIATRMLWFGLPLSQAITKTS
jgi:hypothetical protein